MKNYLNLLPWEHQRRCLIRKRLFQWSVVWFAVCAVVVAVLYVQQRKFDERQQEVALLQQRSEPIQQMRLQNQKIQWQLAEFEGRESLLSELQQKQPSIRLIGIVSRSASRSAGRLQVEVLELVPKAMPVTKTKPNKPALPKVPESESSNSPMLMSLTLSGIAMDDLAITGFINALRASDSFETVELRSSVATEVANIDVRKYVVECGF